MSVARIEPWSKDGLALLTRLNGDPVMMAHLGGAETAAKIAERQARYSRPDSGQFQIIDAPSHEPAGWVGFWEREWREQPVYEMGWSVAPEFQGRGLAGAATVLALEAVAAVAQTRRYVHAFPNVDNRPSNGVCARAGFTLVGPTAFEYPPGHTMACNDWRFDLRGAGAQPAA